jgi:hypothetical protein
LLSDNLRGRRRHFMLQQPEQVFRRITTTVCLIRAQTLDGNLRISSRRRSVASLARCPKGHTASQATKHVHASPRLAASEDEACHSHGYKQQTPLHGGWPLFASCGSSMHLPPFPITCHILTSLSFPDARLALPLPGSICNTPSRQERPRKLPRFFRESAIPPTFDSSTSFPPSQSPVLGRNLYGRAGPTSTPAPLCTSSLCDRRTGAAWADFNSGLDRQLELIPLGPLTFERGV